MITNITPVAEQFVAYQSGLYIGNIPNPESIGWKSFLISESHVQSKKDPNGYLNIMLVHERLSGSNSKIFAFRTYNYSDENFCPYVTW